MPVCLYVCASSKHLTASGNKWKIAFFLINKKNKWKEITCSLQTHIKAGQSWCDIWQAPIPGSLCFSSVLTHTGTVCMWREFCQLSRIFPSEAEIFPYWFMSKMSADFIIVVLATTMPRSAMFEGYGGTRGNSDTDVSFDFQNKGASSRWSCWSLFPFWTDVNQFIINYSISSQLYEHLHVRICSAIVFSCLFLRVCWSSDSN